MVTIKMDPRLREAIRKLAVGKGLSISALTRHLLIEELRKEGIDWREEELEE